MQLFAGQDFSWGTMIEDTFIPQARSGLRSLEEYELTQHYNFWRQDLDLAASLGVSYLRWGVPWYKVNPAPGQFDWRWVDEVLDYMINIKGMHLIVDLMHYGTPLWMENSFINAQYPQRVAEYAYAFTARYHHLVRCYTPLNEPTINALYCGQRAEWPPYLEGEDGYAKILMQVVRGMVLTAEAIHQAMPDALLVQVEALGWQWSQDPSLEAYIELHRQRRYLAFDLLIGHVDAHHPRYSWLLSHGFTEDDLSWIRERAARVDVLGANVYPWSGGEMMRDADGTIQRVNLLEGHHLGDVLREAWSRYHIPLMVTETSALRDVPGRAQWMDETIAAVQSARAEGMPVLGYTWFALFSLVDWDYRLNDKPLSDSLWHLALWELARDEDGILQRMPTPLVERYRQHVLGLRSR